ncbi:MAG TPA: PAS domain-containing protein, partial [Polyangiaceae bacterium]
MSGDWLPQQSTRLCMLMALRRLCRIGDRLSGKPWSNFVGSLVAATVAVLACALIQLALSHWLINARFALFCGGVALAAWVAGLGAGLLACLLSALVVNGLFLTQHFGFGGSHSNFVPTLTFLMASSTVAWLCYLGRLATMRADRLVQFLARTRELYDLLFANMREGLAYCQVLYRDQTPVDFVFLAVNDSFERLTGFGKPIGKHLSEIKPEIFKSNPEVLERCGSVALNGTSERFECFIDSLNTWFAVSVYSPSRGRLVAIFDDISAKRSSESALKASEERYRSLFESSQDAIMILCAPDYRYMAGNAAALRLFGVRDLYEFTSLAPWELSPPRQPGGAESIPTAMEMIAMALRDGSHYFEWTHSRLDGSEFETTVLLTRVEIA